MCFFNETCGLGVALEHNGDLYSCDHFVDPEFLLGNIADTDMGSLVGSRQQHDFGADKRDLLPRYCLDCDVRFACHGECPKNRFIETPDGEPGLNYLCAGYKEFFHHIDEPVRMIASLLQTNRPAQMVMRAMAHQDAEMEGAVAEAGRNGPCPCGSGEKTKRCHGASATRSPSRHLPTGAGPPRPRVGRRAERVQRSD
jgi:uncharacterized protein